MIPGEQAIKGIMKGLSKFEAEIGAENIELAAKGLYNSSSKETKKLLRTASSENVSNIVSHDIDVLGHNSFEDYIKNTSIFQDTKAGTSDMKKVVQALEDKGVMNLENDRKAKEAVGRIKGTQPKINANPTNDTASNTNIIDEIVTKNKNMQDVINSRKKGTTSPEVEHLNRIDREQISNMNALKDAIGNQEKLNSLGKKFGIEGDATEAAIKNAIDKNYKTGLEAGPNLKDNFWGNKIPQKVAGLGTTAWLISSMFETRGQQSNAELYNQQTPYQQY